jgi:hypothetical protein
MRLVIAAAMLMLTMASALAQGAQQRHVFEHWTASCRSDGYCSATAAPEGGTAADYLFRIGRHAEEIYWELSFTTLATQAVADRQFMVQVDVDAQTFLGAEQVAAYGAPTNFYFLGQNAQTVMDWLAPSSTLAVEFTDTDNSQRRVGFSLAGLNAALIWIDEKQGRLGSERVAEAAPIGLAPVTGIDPDSPIPPAMLAWLAADGECREEDPPTAASDIIDLSPTKRAFILPCWYAAYNTGSKLFIEDGAIISQAYFPEYSVESGWTATDYLVNYDYDPRTGEISTFYRGTGMGNCGATARYVWGEYQFKLIEYRSQPSCESDNRPGDFPLVYSAGPAPLAAIARQLPQALFDAHNGNGDCPLKLDTTTVGAVVMTPINQTQTYYAVRCAEYDGRYAMAIYVDDAGEVWPQSFLDDDRGELYKTGTLFEPAFDPVSGRLTSTRYLDASGTCGTRSTWTWNGTDFEAGERRAKYECDGVPGDWPVVEPEFNP